MASYATIAECRAVLNMQSSEWTDAAVQQLLDSATSRIDLRSGRTWQGQQTVTDEKYDGNGTDTLYLKQVDLSSLDALSVDTARNGTFTSITVTKVRYYANGRLTIEANVSPEVSVFTEGPQTVKVSYKYGRTTSSTEFALVRDLTFKLVAQGIKFEEERETEIESIFNEIGRGSISLL